MPPLFPVQQYNRILLRSYEKNLLLDLRAAFHKRNPILADVSALVEEFSERVTERTLKAAVGGSPYLVRVVLQMKKRLPGRTMKFKHRRLVPYNIIPLRGVLLEATCVR